MEFLDLDQDHKVDQVFLDERGLQVAWGLGHGAFAPSKLLLKSEGKPLGFAVDAVAQITKTGHTWLFDRVTGAPLFPVEERNMPQGALPGDQLSRTQRFPVNPPPFARQQLTRNDLTRRTPAATWSGWL